MALPLPLPLTRYKCLLLDTSAEGLRHFRIEPFRDVALQSRAAQILEATGQDFSGVRYGHTMAPRRTHTLPLPPPLNP